MRTLAGSRRKQLDVGIYLNNRAAVFLGEEFGVTDLVDLAAKAEALEFDSVWVGDSVLAKPRWSALLVLSAIATRTSRVLLSTGIFQPQLRNPVLFAQEVATLDQLSEGRVRLALGTGAGRRDLTTLEHRAVGVRVEQRGAVFEEVIELSRRLLAGERVSYEGRFHSLEEVDIGLRSLQQPHPPMLIAAGTFIPTSPGTGTLGYWKQDRAGKFFGPFDRVARLGDGWITTQSTADEYARAWELIQELAVDKYGRDPAIFDTAYVCWINVDDDERRAWEEGKSMLESYNRRSMDPESVDRKGVYGSVAHCVDHLAAFVDSGARTFELVIASPRQREQMERIGAEVLPALRAATPGVLETNADQSR